MRLWLCHNRSWNIKDSFSVPYIKIGAYIRCKKRMKTRQIIIHSLFPIIYNGITYLTQRDRHRTIVLNISWNERLLLQVNKAAHLNWLNTKFNNNVWRDCNCWLRPVVEHSCFHMSSNDAKCNALDTKKHRSPSVKKKPFINKLQWQVTNYQIRSITKRPWWTICLTFQSVKPTFSSFQWINWSAR